MKKLVKQIVYRKFAKVLAKILPYSWYLKLMLDSVEVQGNSYASNRILCLPKPLFDKDFEQLSYRLRDYGWIWFEKHMFKACFEGLIPGYARQQKIYAEFLNDPNVRWDKVIDKAKLLIRALKEQHGVCCMVTANVDYYQDHALKIACQSEGIPVVVLQKEYPITEEIVTYFENYYSNWNPNAEVVAVAGHLGEKGLKNAGIGQHSKIIITGFPRLDRYRSIDMIGSNVRPQITLLSFRSGYGKDSEGVFFQFLEYVLDRVGHSIPILIKAKNSTDKRIISEKINSKLKKIENNKVNIQDQIPLYDAFAFSTLIVGYNSLSLVEALLTKAHILIPSYVLNEAGILSETECEGGGVTFCHSLEQLLSKLDEAASGQLTPLTSEQLLVRKQVFQKYWKWDEDVSASEHFGEVLKTLVKN